MDAISRERCMPTMRLTMDIVRRALSADLPGAAAHERMMARPRSTSRGEMSGSPRQSAVLIALYERNDDIWFPLTVRSHHVRKHKGQISFPGGAFESADQTLWHTAVREAHEELGLDPEDVRRLGRLSELCIVSSGFCVHPYVASVSSHGLWRIDENEVAQVVEMPLDLLLDERLKQVTEWPIEGGTRRIPHYAYEGHVIWGATAMMLSELEQVLRGALAMSQEAQ